MSGGAVGCVVLQYGALRCIAMYVGCSTVITYTGLPVAATVIATLRRRAHRAARVAPSRREAREACEGRGWMVASRGRQQHLLQSRAPSVVLAEITSQQLGMAKGMKKGTREQPSQCPASGQVSLLAVMAVRK